MITVFAAVFTPLQEFLWGRTHERDHFSEMSLVMQQPILGSVE